METNAGSNKALVLHSGGQDSTTCLAWALEKFDEVETISFDYGQRHKIELDSAAKISENLNLTHTTIPVNSFQSLGETSLTHDINVSEDRSEKGMLTSFVPGRNLIFLTLAAAYAYSKDITNLVTGVCQTDYSDYPDCREETMQSLEKSINLGMDSKFTIHTPLMHLTKAESIKLIQELGHFDLLKDTHTCYKGGKPACGECPACQLRLKGFKEAGIADPISYKKI